MDQDDLKSVFCRVESLQKQVVENLARLVEIPSIAGHTEACRTAAAVTAEFCEDAGFSVEVWEGPGAPALFAEITAPDNSPTVLFYGHYDVQPVEPLEAWVTPPFKPTIRDDALFGRGAGDNKGQFICHIAAVKALKETVGCPVGVKLLIEGEEEIGSPHLEDLVTTNAGRLSCDVVITADGPYHADGHPLIIFGVRGLLFLDATISGAPQDLHSGSSGGIAPAPTHELVSALAAMWNKDGSVAIPGFYDDIVRPTFTEGSLAAQLPYPNWAEEEASVDGTLPPPWTRLMFEPNLNIAGLASGYNGPGVKTVIPRHARAKIDVRLVVNQDPHKVYASLRRFLEQRGVEVSLLAAVPPSWTPIGTPLAVPVQRAIEASWGHSPLLQPRLGGTTPDYVFTRTLSVPSLLVPYAPADMHHHAPNERIPLEALHRGVRTTAAICVELSNLSPRLAGATKG